MKIETLLARTGCEPRPDTGSVIAPIDLATTFERAEDGSYPHGYIYSRMSNPTRDLFERSLAAVEGGDACCAFASGMAAVSAVLMALQPGDHVLIPDDVYYGVRKVLSEHLSGWGLAWSDVDMSDPQAVAAALRPETRMVWLETPSNPMLKITDVSAVSAIAHAHGAIVVADATWTPPPVQRCLELGADVVVHSVTKYIGGHSDVLGGAVIARQDEELFARIKSLQATAGGVMDPFSAWLAMRGMRSLAARLRIHTENASRLAGMLARHPAVARVHFPGLPTHPGHEVAQRQMTSFGGMLSFEVHGGREQAFRVAAGVKVFTRATSLGGTESLIEHRASSEAQPTRTPESLLRVSVGLEHPDDLLDDLSQALDSL